METIKIKGFNAEIELILADLAAVLITAIVVLIISAASNGDNAAVKRVAPAIILSLVSCGLALKKAGFPISNDNSLISGLLVMAILFFVFPVSVLVLLISIKEFFAHWWKITLLNGTASLMAPTAVLSSLSGVIDRVPWRFSLSFFFITAAFCFFCFVFLPV